MVEVPLFCKSGGFLSPEDKIQDTGEDSCTCCSHRRQGTVLCLFLLTLFDKPDKI